MMKKTHMMFGFFFFLICNFYFNFPIELSVFAIIGSTFPDLDIKFQHRKILHNLWVLGIIATLLLVNPWYPIGILAVVIFSLGFISHLVADSMTKMGISWLWPLTFPHIEGGITTGSSKEYVFSIIILLFCFIILYGTDKLLSLIGV